MSRQKISDADLRACAEAGLNMAETARALNVNIGSVRWHADRDGIAFTRARKSCRKIDESALRDCAARGLTLTQAARELRASLSGVRNRAVEIGVIFTDGRIARHGAAPRPDRAVRPRTLAEAAALENAAAKAVWRAGEVA